MNRRLYLLAAAALATIAAVSVYVATTKTDEVNRGLPDSAIVRLSPGDLDEAVATFLAFGAKAAEVKSGTAERGTAFERLDAFRSGFFEAFNEGLANGIRACMT